MPMTAFPIWLCVIAVFSTQIFFFTETSFYTILCFSLNIIFHSFPEFLLKMCEHRTLLEWPESITLTPPNAGEDVEQ